MSGDSAQATGLRVIRTDSEDSWAMFPALVVVAVLIAAAVIQGGLFDVSWAIIGFLTIAFDIGALRKRRRTVRDALEAATELPIDAVVVSPLGRIARWWISPRRLMLYALAAFCIYLGYAEGRPGMYSCIAGILLATIVFQASARPIVGRSQKSKGVDLYEPAFPESQTVLVFLTKARG